MIVRRRSREQLPALTSTLLCRWHWSLSSQRKTVSFGGTMGRPRVTLGLAANSDALHIFVQSPEKMENPEWPDYTSGDAVEIFLATRLWQSAHAMNRFSHRILVFPTPVEGVQSREISEHPLLERRQLMPENALHVTFKCEKRGSSLAITIPWERLYQFDYSEKSCGFAVAIHHAQLPVLWWPGDGRPLDRLYSLWATLHLEEG